MKKIYLKLFLLCLVFLVSCGSTKNVKTAQFEPEVLEPEKEEASKNIEIVQPEIEKILEHEQEEVILKETELPTPSEPNINEQIIVLEEDTEISEEAEAHISYDLIEEILIVEDNKQGIIVDESVVDDFEEKYEPTIEEEDFKETEEAKIIEEMEKSTIPVEEIEVKEEIKAEAEKEIIEELKRADKLLEEEKVIYDIPIVINKRVEYFLDYFQNGKMRKIMSKWLNRSTRYLPMMRKIFEEKGLPKDLTYLAMIESGFNTSAYSRARAVGPWQFIKGTGRKYGLKIDYWIDERRDPLKATIAAANYLKDLHDLFGSWYLAAAAYNAGEGKISRAIKRHNTEDFWELSKYRYIKRETKNYIPKLLAAILISKEPEKYGFTVEQMPLYEYDEVEIDDPTDLDIIAKSAKVSLTEIKELNPELRRWYSPPISGSYKLKIPKGTEDTFVANYSKLKPAEKINFLTYRIRHGETLSHVARKFGASVPSIMKINRIRSAKRVRAGVELIIPIKGGVSVASLRKAYQPKIERSELILVPKGETVSYTVKKGDSLWDIAQRSGIKVTDIINLNNMKSSKIYPGKKLLLYKTPPRKVAAAKASVPKADKQEDKNYYTVKAGDTLWSISQKFGTSIKELRKINNLKRRSQRWLIKPGQKILVASNDKKVLPKKAVKIAASYADKETKHITYKVKKGDTLWDIAKRHNIGISEIKALNNLKSNKIKPGDELKIKMAEI